MSLISDHIPLSSSPTSSLAPVTTKALAPMELTHSYTNRKKGMGMGAQGAIGKSDHSYRIEAMPTITNASSGANTNANHHHDITFEGDSQEIPSTRSGGSQTYTLFRYVSRTLSCPSDHFPTTGGSHSCWPTATRVPPSVVPCTCRVQPPPAGKGLSMSGSVPAFIFLS